MAIDRGVLAILEAQPGRGEDLASFLRQARELAAEEEGTVTWYAFRLGQTTYGIFDTFADEGGRRAHLEGPIPVALGRIAADVLAAEPDITLVDLVAAT
jgi:quinol monooxygenase YgiN